MRLLVVIAFLFACFPVHANGNHEKNSHRTPAPTVTDSGGNNGHKNRTAYLILGAVGVYAVWSWGKKDDKKGIQFGVRVKEGQ